MTVGRGCHETFTEIWRGGAEKVRNLANRLRELFDEPPSRLAPKTSLSTALKNDRCRRWRRASGPNHLFDMYPESELTTMSRSPTILTPKVTVRLTSYVAAAARFGACRAFRTISCLILCGPIPTL